MNKKFVTRICIALILIIAAGIISRALKGGTATINIPSGANSKEIAEILKDNGIIRSKAYFLARLYISPYRGKLRYGTFKIDRNSFLNTVFKILTTDGAQRETVSVTIPEGFSVEMIEDRLTELDLCTKSEFEAALSKEYDYDFLKSIPASRDIKYRLQGFLFPETYEFYTDTSAENIIDTMLKEFQLKTESLNISSDRLFEIVTKASLVEREAQLDSERSIIAGVIDNRLKKNMRLQIDATVAYAVSDGRYNKDRILYKDLDANSKYNTYRFSGLPIGPICCPSLKSISAAAAPAKHKYLYYHTDTKKNDGSHIFSENFSEHTSTIK